MVADSRDLYHRLPTAAASLGVRLPLNCRMDQLLRQRVPVRLHQPAVPTRLQMYTDV